MRRAQNGAKLGHRVVLGIFGDAASPPFPPESRTQYCSYVVDALSRAKNVTDVVIWNEVNSALFWRPQKDAPGCYAALLAECYDTLHKYRRTVNVITSTSPHEDPGRFLRDMGVAYRASGRTLPIFDTLGHNAYPEYTRESPFATHPALPSIDQGDYVRLMQMLDDRVRAAPPSPCPAVAHQHAGDDRQERSAGDEWPVTIWYLEDGFETVVSDRQALSVHGERDEPATRATDLAQGPRHDRRAGSRESDEGRARARVLPARGRRVLQLPVRGRGRPGRLAIRPRLGRRHAEAFVRPVKAVFAAIAAGTVDCARLPFSATGPRPVPTATTHAGNHDDHAVERGR